MELASLIIAMLVTGAVGGVLAGAAAIGVAAHAVASGISKATGKKKVQVTEEANNG